jgi:hypothetical protein
MRFVFGEIKVRICHGKKKKRKSQFSYVFISSKKDSYVFTHNRKELLRDEKERRIFVEERS